MDKQFTSKEVVLKHLLEQASTGAVQLPDFQRGWVWDDEHIKSLLASISLSYPIGAVMTLQTGNPDVRFKARPLEGVEGVPEDQEPELLLLDGQQRSTSLYLALRSGKPVDTRDAKGKDLQRWYYADIDKCLDPEADREENAIISVPADKTVRTFRGEVTLDLSTRELEIEHRMFPLAIVLDSTAVMRWQFDFVGNDNERHEIWRRFYEEIVYPFDRYEIPAIELTKTTSKDAVCRVFEKVNTGGVPLSVFELLTATFAADGYVLRDDWAERKIRFKQHAVLENLDAPQFIQVVSLLATYDRRRNHLAEGGGDDKAPAISCKRRDLLRLTKDEYVRWADDATEGLLRVVPLLHTEHIFRARDLPYATQLVPLAAVLALLGDKADTVDAIAAITRWLWSGVFGEMYGGSTETRFALDVQDLVAWIAGSSTDEPRTIREAQFQAERLLTLRTRNSAAYKGIYALQMKRGARDFRTGKTIDVHAYFEDAIDIHHVFPQAWTAKNDVRPDLADCIVNKTPIDAKTNRQIGGRAPSVYLARMKPNDEAVLDEILRSHEIDPVALERDDFSAFFDARFERLITLIEAATGKRVNRPADGTGSPFADTTREADTVLALIDRGESQTVEFKSTARLNLHTGERDPRIEWSSIKTIAGFMNAKGGTLLIGVDDDGQAVGIDQEFRFHKNRDRDGWELWLTDALTNAFGKAAAAEIHTAFSDHDGLTVARIEVVPSAGPVFARDAKGAPERFMVRINNSTQELTGSELLSYQKKRWG